MTQLDILSEQATQAILRLEFAKKRSDNLGKDHDTIKQLALLATDAQFRLYEVEKEIGEKGQNLAITLVSQASCFVDAWDLDRARAAYNLALEHAETEKFRAWISEEIKAITT